MGSRARIARLAADANTSYLAGDYRSVAERYRLRWLSRNPRGQYRRSSSLP